MLEPKTSISNSKQQKQINPPGNCPNSQSFLEFINFFLQVDTESGTSIPRWEKPRTLKSKFLSFFQKFKTLHSKKLTIAAGKTQNVQNPDSKLLVDQQGEFSYKRPFCIGSLLVGILALLSESICEKNKKGIIFHGSFILLYIAFLFKKYITGKAMTSLVFLTIATTVCAVMFRSDKYMDYDQVLVSEFVWKAWNYAASSGCLYELSQVIFSRFAKPWVRCSQSPNNWMT
ncbi:hypothetical protein OIU78_001611 [Salix suchowensis]|nr:hypothetical protein OIU78_001611 [Salix suchowensis]